jgi:hypothetical protein
MVDWMRHLRRGKNFLSRHDPAAAMKSFQNAVDLCPLERTKDLANSLSTLGFPFKSLVSQAVLSGVGRLLPVSSSAGILTVC